jgi:hypothetical protein
MTATFAFSLIAFLLMLGVVADSLWDSASGVDPLRRAKIKSGLGAIVRAPAQKALPQKSKTITPPSIVPVNSINQSKGIRPNGRLCAKDAIIL